MHLAPADHLRGCAQILDPPVGARADEHLVDGDIGDLRARFQDCRFASSPMRSGSGTVPSTETTSSGLVPQETMGGSFAASSVTTRSNLAPSSLFSVSQERTASA